MFNKLLEKDDIVGDYKKNHILRYIIYIFYFFNRPKRNYFISQLKNLFVLIQYKKIEKIAKKRNAFYLFSRNGIGDVYFVASLLKEFKKANNNAKIIYLTEKKSIAEFLKSFNYIDKIIYNRHFKFQSFSPLQRPIDKKYLNFLFFPYRGTRKNYVFADNYNNFLGLPLDTKREQPIISEENIKNAEEEFKRLEINPNKTIILITDSVMFDYRVLKKEFWINFAKMLKNNGYDVVFNTQSKIKGFKNTFLPIMDFVAFCKKVKYIYSFRSGINDLLVPMGITNLSVIYPYNMEVIWADKFIFDNLMNKYHEKLYENEFDNIFHIYSLNSNFKDKNIDEIIFDGYDQEEFSKQLFKKLK